MNLTAWLDVAIGLSLVYLGASLFVTIIGEYISQAFNLRGRAVFQSLAGLISDSNVRQKLARNAALRPFFGSDPDCVGKRCPSYIDPIVLARALLGGDKPGTPPALPPSLHGIVGAVGEGTAQRVAALSHWVDASLTMLGEGYKRWLRRITFGVAICVTVVLNLDTVALTAHLYRDKEARDAMAAVAIDVTGRTDKAAFEHCMAMTPQERGKALECTSLNGLVEVVRGRNASLGQLPIGWGAARSIFSLAQVVGWLLTALALSLGAPFWFDILGRFVNVRHGMRPPDISMTKDEKGDDREAIA